MPKAPVKGGFHPFEFVRRLDGTGERNDRLVEMLREAKQWIEATDLEQLIDAILGDRASCRALFDRSDRLDHIGFPLPGWTKDLLSRAATAAGFPLGHRAFPSALVAREIGRIVGRRRIDTQIFKAHGRTAEQRLGAFEAFIPSADDAQVEDWLRRGIVQHIAVEISDPTRFARIWDAFAEAGLRISGFMYGRAIYLPGEDATITYFDLDHSEHPFRLEIRASGDHQDRVKPANDE